MKGEQPLVGGLSWGRDSGETRAYISPSPSSLGNNVHLVGIQTVFVEGIATRAVLLAVTLFLLAG